MRLPQWQGRVDVSLNAASDNNTSDTDDDELLPSNQGQRQPVAFFDPIQADTELVMISSDDRITETPSEDIAVVLYAALICQVSL
jgi:hypothetical protein